MFPYQQWRVECAPDKAADEAAGEAEADGAAAAAAATAAWLDRLAAAGGEAALARLQPYELLGVGAFASADAAKAASRQLGRHFHPDKNLGDAEKAARAELVFVAVRAALASFLDGSWRQDRSRDEETLKASFITDEATPRESTLPPPTRCLPSRARGSVD